MLFLSIPNEKLRARRQGVFAYPRKKVQSRITPPKRCRFRSGFQPMGALYHHFENKEALGYAVVDEVIATMMRDKWLRPLEHAKNPIDALARIVASLGACFSWRCEAKLERALQ
jgi:hypothetical protein